MKAKKRYQGLNQVMRAIKIQIQESMPYAWDNFGGYTDPADLFRYLRELVTYKNDPANIELIHTVQSFLHDNQHGIPGAGDCDDFTILATAALCANGIENRIVLAGRNSKYPVHIYSEVKTGSGWVPFDLTQRTFGNVKYYPYLQTIPVKCRFT